MLYGQDIKEGDAYSAGNKLVAATGSVTISAHTGAIVPSYYTGEVSGVETALTLTVKGLGAIPSGKKGDVNGDGIVNTADVTTVYNYIENPDATGLTLERVDLNGDGQVNATDVIELYNMISGADASSKAFQSVIRRLLAK